MSTSRRPLFRISIAWFIFWLSDAMLIFQSFWEPFHDIGLPSKEVRAYYHSQLQAVKEEIRAAQSNNTLSVCEIARMSASGRVSARYRSRARGSLIGAGYLWFRDKLVYGLASDFSFDSLMELKRRKLQKDGKHVDTDTVCQALVDSSTTSNELYNKIAVDNVLSLGCQGYLGYLIEVTLMHLAAFCIALAVAWIWRLLHASVGLPMLFSTEEHEKNLIASQPAEETGVMPTTLQHSCRSCLRRCCCLLFSCFGFALVLIVSFVSGSSVLLGSHAEIVLPCILNKMRIPIEVAPYLRILDSFRSEKTCMDELWSVMCRVTPAFPQSGSESCLVAPNCSQYEHGFKLLQKAASKMKENHAEEISRLRLQIDDLQKALSYQRDEHELLKLESQCSASQVPHGYPLQSTTSTTSVEVAQLESPTKMETPAPPIVMVTADSVVPASHVSQATPETQAYTASPHLEAEAKLIPSAQIALAVLNSRTLQSCDDGVSASCPSLHDGMVTWRYGIQHLREALGATRTEPDIRDYIAQIGNHVNLFLDMQPPPGKLQYAAVANNCRMVFETVRHWLDMQPSVDIHEDDERLPRPVRGLLCHASCDSN